MSPNAPAPSISISSIRSIGAGGAVCHASPLAQTLRAIGASWRVKMAERLHVAGVFGYLGVWLLGPIFELSIAGLIYGHSHPELIRYVAVAMAANACVFNSIYYVGEILDRERMAGTLVGLFLAPCSRWSWLSGFTLVSLVETALRASVALAFGALAFGVRYNPNLPALLLTLPLYIAPLWGFGFIFSAVGILLKKANQFSNVVYPFAVVLGGVYYPVALMPLWLRLPARLLPLGYGTQALASATLDHAGIRALLPQLLPLAGFAVLLPVAGGLVFNWLERVVRVRGELDLY